MFKLKKMIHLILFQLCLWCLVGKLYMFYGVSMHRINEKSLHALLMLYNDECKSINVINNSSKTSVYIYLI